MITVFPEKDIKAVEEYYKKAGFTFCEDSAAVTARSDDQLLGYCIFDIEKDTVILHDIEPKDDILLFDGILRSALHVAAGKFIFKAKYDNEKLEPMLRQLDFIIDAQKRTVNMDKLFGGCSCGKEK